jgi:hypothetical protein
MDFHLRLPRVSRFDIRVKKTDGDDDGDDDDGDDVSNGNGNSNQNEVLCVPIPNGCEPQYTNRVHTLVVCVYCTALHCTALHCTALH